MSKLVKTRHQAKFKDFKGFGAFKGLVEQKTLYLTRSCVNWAFFWHSSAFETLVFCSFSNLSFDILFSFPIFCYILLFIVIYSSVTLCCFFTPLYLTFLLWLRLRLEVHLQWKKWHEGMGVQYSTGGYFIHYYLLSSPVVMSLCN
jgi:hypothetical protein